MAGCSRRRWKNLQIKIPMESGNYKGIDFGSGTTFDLKNVSVNVYVKLNYLSSTNPKGENCEFYDLRVKTNQESSTDPIAAVISLNDPSQKIDFTNQSILRGLFEGWLNEPDNLKKFNTLFSTVQINALGKESEEYHWLKATATSYAYADKGDEESSIFGVLCMTEGHPSEGLPSQLPAVSLEQDNNSMFW